MADSPVLWFEEIGMGDVPQVGGKNASLGELIQSLKAKGVRVPDGFATTADAYRRFLKANGIEAAMRSRIQSYRSGETSLRATGEAIRELFLDSEFPEDIAGSIRSHYRELGERAGQDRLSVAVRSSATAEDLPDASFAGQQETFLNIAGERELLDACRRCYASLFTDRAISYREVKGFDHLDVALSIGVQRMVRSDVGASGRDVLHRHRLRLPPRGRGQRRLGPGRNRGPGHHQPGQIPCVQAAPGGSRGRGRISPIIEKTLGSKDRKMVYSRGGHARTKMVDTSDAERRAFVLDDAEILALARWAVSVEEHYARPMDMEWARDGVTGELFMVQARPETVQSQKTGSRFTLHHLLEHGTVLALRRRDRRLDRAGHGLRDQERGGHRKLPRRRHPCHRDDRPGLGSDHEAGGRHRHRPRRPHEPRGDREPRTRGPRRRRHRQRHRRPGRRPGRDHLVRRGR